MWVYHYPGLESIEDRRLHWELNIPEQTMQLLYPRSNAWPRVIVPVSEYLGTRDKLASKLGIKAFLHMWYFSNKTPIWDETARYVCEAQNTHTPVALVWCWKMPHMSAISSCIPHDLAPRCKIREAIQNNSQLLDGVDYLIHHYLSSSNYMCIGGRQILIFYHIEGWQAMCSAFGSPFSIVRDAFRKSGIDPYLIGIATSVGDALRPELMSGLDAIARYNDLPDFRGVDQQDFRERTISYISGWQTQKKALRRFDLDFIPSVSMGWNASPRFEGGNWNNSLKNGYPLSPTVSRPSSEDISWAISVARNNIKELGLHYLTLCAWNEWTENAALEYFAGANIV